MITVNIKRDNWLILIPFGGLQKGEFIQIPKRLNIEFKIGIQYFEYAVELLQEWK